MSTTFEMVIGSVWRQRCAELEAIGRNLCGIPAKDLMVAHTQRDIRERGRARMEEQVRRAAEHG